MLRPFLIEFPDAEVEDLRGRLRSTRWSPAQTVDDWSQGVPLEYLSEMTALSRARARS